MKALLLRAHLHVVVVPVALQPFLRGRVTNERAAACGRRNRCPDGCSQERRRSFRGRGVTSVVEPDDEPDVVVAVQFGEGPHDGPDGTPLVGRHGVTAP